MQAFERNTTSVELVTRIQAEGLNRTPCLVENTLALGRARLEQLRALGARDVIIAHDEAELAGVAAPTWSSSIDSARLLSNVVTTAGNVDLDYGSADPLFSQTDITDLILMAAQCCTPPDAIALDEARWIDELEWTPLADKDDGTTDASPRPNVVRVGGALHSERCHPLEFAVVPADRDAVVGATALLTVSMSEREE